MQTIEEKIGIVNRAVALELMKEFFHGFQKLPRKGKSYITVSPRLDLALGKKDIRLEALGGGAFAVYKIRGIV